MVSEDTAADDPLPYWNANVPESQRTDKCPAFLCSQSEKNKGILSAREEDYQVITWSSAKRFVADKRPDFFQRSPTQLRQYLEFQWKLKTEYGSVTDFLLRERLHWDAPVTPRGKPFECVDDVKILWNDWPYGLDDRIVHLVVWTKFKLEEDPQTGGLTRAATAEIDDFVNRTFAPHVQPSELLWFCNWAAIKSVPSLDHFHVMLFQPPTEIVDRITSGDVPLSRTVAAASDVGLPSPAQHHG